MQQENIEKIQPSPLRVVKSEKIEQEEPKNFTVKKFQEPKTNMPPERQRYIKAKKHDFF